MGRPKGFNRETVLQKAMSVFWERGYADTSLRDLETATGVDRSGLYAEFKNMEDLFVESLKHYLQNRGGVQILSTQPYGLDNVQRFLKICQTDVDGLKGCFSVNTMREVAVLPAEVQSIMVGNQELMKRLLIRNIKADLPDADAGLAADMVLTFFSGLCIEQNLGTKDSVATRKIAGLMKSLQQM
jgi:TetR/AcrR family transcriptional regulator, copper-responsive repressor